jgi:hypothetical protein
VVGGERSSRDQYCATRCSVALVAGYNGRGKAGIIDCGQGEWHKHVPFSNQVASHQVFTLNRKEHRRQCTEAYLLVPFGG